MKAYSFLGLDLGASNGRAVLGQLEQERLVVTELHRFPNEMVEIHGHLFWDIARLYQEVKTAIKLCTQSYGPLDGLAVDTWGVDFGLIGADGTLLGLPYAYRDARTDGAPDEFFAKMPRERLYHLTGIQIMPINSVFQLQAMKRDNSSALKLAEEMLFMPDLLGYFLTGEKKTELTIATTSQLYNPSSHHWEHEIFTALGVPETIMQEIIEPGSVLGNLCDSVAQETGAGRVPVIATASHDTASAVAAVPVTGDDWAYISSGTWSLVGIESERPVLTDLARNLNFTNEGGICGTFRFLKNVCGLWLLQECRRIWGAERYSFTELIESMQEITCFRSLIDPDHSIFLHPPDMPEAIRRFCLASSQPVPTEPAEFVRCIFESLALKYWLVLDQIREATGRSIKVLHVVGGGALNTALCQFTADATGLPVVAGPVEATATGNILGQAIAAKAVSGLSQLRDISRNSVTLVRYEPRDSAKWEAVRSRFLELCKTDPMRGEL